MKYFTGEKGVLLGCHPLVIDCCWVMKFQNEFVLLYYKSLTWLVTGKLESKANIFHLPAPPNIIDIFHIL